MGVKDGVYVWQNVGQDADGRHLGHGGLLQNIRHAGLSPPGCLRVTDKARGRHCNRQLEDFMQYLISRIFSF